MNSKDEPLEDSNISNKDMNEIIPHTQSLVYTLLAGMVGLIIYFEVMVTADFFDKSYPGYSYYYISYIPQNVAIPFSFILQKQISQFGISRSIVVLSLLSVILGTSQLLFPILYPGSLPAYIFLMVLLFFASMVMYVVQSLTLGVVLWFGPSFQKNYFVGIGLGNIALALLRILLGYTNLEPVTDVIELIYLNIGVYNICGWSSASIDIPSSS